VTDLRTSRLLMRDWRPEDREPFAALNADPVTMEHFPSTLTREQSDAFVARIAEELRERGWGLWAVEVPGEGFAGFVGLTPVAPDLPFAPAVEVGWRLALPYWGRGLATEAARVAVDHGFRTLGLHEIVSMTTVANSRSRRVMEKLGMHRDPADDFDHPRVPVGHPVRPHVLYRLRARRAAEAAAGGSR